MDHYCSHFIVNEFGINIRWSKIIASVIWDERMIYGVLFHLVTVQ